MFMDPRDILKPYVASWYGIFYDIFLDKLSAIFKASSGNSQIEVYLKRVVGLRIRSYLCCH